MSTVFDVTHNCYPLQMGFPIQHIIKLFIQAKASLVGCVFVFYKAFPTSPTLIQKCTQKFYFLKMSLFS